MAPQQQKVQLTYKLFLLENARNKLNQELLTFTNKAYEEVQGFLNSSFPPRLFSDLAKALDTRCQAIDKLSALLKDFTVEPQAYVRNGERTNQLQPLGDRGLLITDVLKFGPMLQNSLMASSIAKAVQVLGATVSLQQLKYFFISQTDNTIRSISSSYNSGVANSSLSSHLKAEETEHAVVFQEKRPPDAVIFPPAVIESPKFSPEGPPTLWPTMQAVPPQISNPEPLETAPLISWGYAEDVQVQHQKQTSSQLLHFLRARAKNMGGLEVTVMERSNGTHTPRSPRSKLPSMKTQSRHFTHVTDDLIDAVARKSSRADAENQAPVFRVKRAESSGSLTYTCVIATKTELWDIGDIFTGGESEDGRNATSQVANSHVSVQREKQPLPCKAPKQESNSAAEPAAADSVAVPEFEIRRFEEIEVVVSHIGSPGNFYIQRADSTVRLRALLTDWEAISSYAEQNCIPDIGTQVMGWFPKQEQWCRAQVTKICGVSGGDNAAGGAGTEMSVQVEVKRLDHGDVTCLSLRSIKELTPEMAVLPLQALQVSLANVTPVNGSGWSEEAVGWFKEMVHNRTLYARLYPQGPRVTVELFLEKGKLGAMRRGASLSLRLAQNGHAKHNKLKNVNLMKRSNVQLKMRKQDSDWEKYLISCYTQSKK